MTSQTAFAMTIYTTLVMTKARWPRRLKRLLAMTICLYTCPRFLPENLVIAMGTCPRTLSLRWNVVTEAIFSQVTLVFGLLRYARNDKKQDGRVVLKDSSP